MTYLCLNILKIDSNRKTMVTNFLKRLKIERSVAEISKIRIRKASVSANFCDVNPTIA